MHFLRSSVWRFVCGISCVTPCPCPVFLYWGLSSLSLVSLDKGLPIPFTLLKYCRLFFTSPSLYHSPGLNLTAILPLTLPECWDERSKLLGLSILLRCLFEMFLVFSRSYFYFLFLCLSGYATCVLMWAERAEEGLSTVVTSSYELPDVDAGNCSETLWKNSKCSSLLSHLSTPSLFLICKLLL